ncbi:MAG: tRNA lysidine(34) synthetase TilS [Cylindrospermopsis raciborskii KL1]|uniref:tRNA lysidine(34) synthetase TilS n=1 Tax=Cylindrospermopsis raciborskii TaxID=77022 RepID=UPI001A276075|nr:tRNA lysidine(34) synthetase TilS [Cylindrospermopsis raciborskii]MBG0743325.1 tRNA lysidine(34) synthetase TilS [Cylindrospermopsis raciborskii KL1]
MALTSLHAKIHRTIRHRHLFAPHEHLLVALSGGQDSLCLIKLLVDLQVKWKWKLAIAHCDHRWREDSQANADHVKNLASSWDLPFHLQIAIDPVNSEADARNWRYRVFREIAEDYGYKYIVTGHTSSDRAETLIYNLIRGTGADGLQSLTWQRSLGEKTMLVRPLLEITREQTGKFCQDLDLPVWVDSTNENLQYPRNRIRQQLLPYLAANFNPQVESHLSHTAELLRAEVEYLEQIAHQLRLQASTKCENGDLRLNRDLLKQQPLALQRRVIRQILQEALPQTPNFDHIEKITDLINAPHRSQSDPFPGGRIAIVENASIVIRQPFLTPTEKEG